MLNLLSKGAGLSTLNTKVNTLANTTTEPTNITNSLISLSPLNSQLKIRLRFVARQYKSIPICTKHFYALISKFNVDLLGNIL